MSPQTLCQRTGGDACTRLFGAEEGSEIRSYVFAGGLLHEKTPNSAIKGLGIHWNSSRVILTVIVMRLDKNSQFLSKGTRGGRTFLKLVSL
jgi:hypothetical protein